jgi:hypothetical protein
MAKVGAFMAEPRDPPHPPSEPQAASYRTAADAQAAADRPVRIQLIVALLVGLVLVATGLYLWRRPRAEVDPSLAASVDPSDAGSFAVASDAAPMTFASSVDASPSSGVTLSDVRMLSCHDKGSKKTAPDQCDRLSSIEQGLARAIEQASSCVPVTAGGGTIEYVLDVSFGRKRHPMTVSLPKGARSMKNVKVLAACKKAVSGAVNAMALDGVNHAHARYKMSVTATYPGPLKN